jgi:WD40 repeat protein
MFSFLKDGVDGECLPKGHPSCPFNALPHFVCFGFCDNSVILWNARSAKTVKIFEGHGRPVGSIAFSPDGSFVLSAAFERKLRVWDVLE